VPFRRTVKRLVQWPPVGRVRLGGLDRTRPVDADYGWARGTPVDRFYIDDFLTTHVRDVRGRVLEVGGDDYTRRFGGDRVTRSDVLHAPPGSAQATVVADLADAPGIAGASFDCVIATQTLTYVYDVAAAVATLRRILAPGGVALVTLPGIAKIARHEAELYGDYWRFTTDSATRLFGEFEEVDVRAYGNVLAATAMLHGLAAEEIGARRLDDRDPDYEVLIGVRARAASSPSLTA
jgi:SAM-dependent methyltransferase